jgi:hypothetical protein
MRLSFNTCQGPETVGELIRGMTEAGMHGMVESPSRYGPTLATLPIVLDIFGDAILRALRAEALSIATH